MKIEMSIHKGPADALVTARELPDIDPLRGIDCDEFIYWAEAKWKNEYEEAHTNACRIRETERTLKTCEAFDAECLKMRVFLQGIDDSSLGEGRGQVPRREPKLCIPRKYGLKIIRKCEQRNARLKKVTRMGREAPKKGWQRAEYEWTSGKKKHQKTFTNMLSHKEYDPHKRFWKYLEEVRQLRIERKKNEAKTK